MKKNLHPTVRGELLHLIGMLFLVLYYARWLAFFIWASIVDDGTPPINKGFSIGSLALILALCIGALIDTLVGVKVAKDYDNPPTS